MPPSRLASLRLRAGPLALDFSPRDADLRYLRTASLELVRRVYFVARDRNWLNVPQLPARPRVRVTPGGFTITTSGRSDGGGVSIEWQLAISGTAAGSVTFTVAGRALADCTANRIGLCVHLPIAGFSGARCKLSTGAGPRKELRLPVLVAPHQPCTDIRALRFTLPRRHRLELAFAGDEFEMEDQRNWIDGSFKIYSRPLARGFPYRVRAGESFSHSLSIRVLAAGPAGNAAPSPRGSSVEIRVSRPLPQAAPVVGLGLPRDFALPAPLRDLNPAHLRLDVEDFGHDLAVQLRRARTAAALLGAPLEIAVAPGDRSVARDLAALVNALASAATRIARVLIFGPNGRCATRAEFAAAQRALARCCPDAAFAAGTDFNFAELNRGRPRLPAARAFTFAANPQVHASDEQSIAECLEGLHDAIASARRYLPGAAIGVSRLTLRPQKNPVASAPSPGDASRRFDPRQASAWCAAWTVGALGALQTAGAAFATFYETTGPGGLVSGGRVFPVHRVLADYLRCGDARPIALDISEPLRVAAWARAGRLAVANLTAAPLRVVVAGRTVRLAAHGYRCLSLSS